MELAKSVGVKVYGMSQHLEIADEEYHGILLGFGGLSLEEMKEGLELLGKVYL